MVKENTLYRYCYKLLDRKEVKELFKEKPWILTFLKPTIEIAKGRTYRISGAMAFDQGNKIKIAEWILSDLIESRRMIRHELAHILHFRLKRTGHGHGEEYLRILEAVSGKKFEQDLGWSLTKKVLNARKQLGIIKEGVENESFRTRDSRKVGTESAFNASVNIN